MTINLISAVISTVSAIAGSTLINQDIENAITMITTELVERHDSARCWESTASNSGWLSKHVGGTTSLTTLALLAAGESVHSPRIQRSMDYLSEIENPSTYVLSIRISIWAMFPEMYKKNLRNDTRRLVKTMNISCGGWGSYASPPKTLAETSPLIREFGMIALREAGRSGERIPKQCWSAIANATLATQHRNGGWSYRQNGKQGKTTANMTVAGLNCLLGVDEVYGDNLSKTDAQRLHNAIDKSINWLNKHTTTDNNTGGTALMSYLYALERAAMSCGLAEIRNRDWFVDGAKAVLEAHCGKQKAKGSTINLSFALLFLTRGRVPIALCELTADISHVDPLRVADILASRVSARAEQMLGWQLVTDDDSIDTWLSAPLMFIQHVNAIPEDCTRIQQFLDSGGFVVMVANGKEHKTFTAFANELCPDISAKRVVDTHWSRTLLEKTNARITSWHDGIRDRILLIHGASNLISENPNSKLSKAMMNICCGTAELNCWKERLASTPRTLSRRQIILAEHEGSWDTETSGLSRWKIKTMPIKKATNKTLVLVGGIHANEATVNLADKIIQVAKTGSTVLVESIGGRGGFARAVRQLIEPKCSETLKPDLALSSFSGLRGWSVLHHRKVDSPLVVSIEKGKVLFVDCDIRNALLNQTAWGVHGYDTESAIGLIESLLTR